MNLLLKQLTLFEPTHPLHLQTCDLFIQDGIIKDIQTEIAIENAEMIDGKGCYLSIGWMDFGVQIGEPGFEHREDLQSVSAAAAAGGFTEIAAFPNTKPVIQNKSDVSFLKQFSKNQLINIIPIGAISHDTAGKEITEMYDMHRSGAIAFSDGKKSIQHAGLMLRALQYVKAFNGIIVQHPNDYSIASDGQMHEGSISTRLGMKGIPSLAEELMLQRDIELLDYTDSRLHIHNISTAESVGIIRRAKERGLKITASVAALNLAYTDNALATFDPNYKVQPPLREDTDRKALLKGIKEGVIDFVTSNHVPLEQEVKFLEFAYAEVGTIALETAVATSTTALQGVLQTEEVIEKWTHASRKALQISIPEIAIGQIANLTLFDPEKEWVVTAKNLYSKSKNTPYISQKIKGKVVMTFNNQKIWRADI